MKSLRMLRRQFELDDALAEVIEELVDVQRVARREEGMLVWSDTRGRSAAESSASTPPPAARDPRAYTPKHLADKILQSRSALEGERKQVTVMFADVKGSMELAEEVGAERWHDILDRFFSILTVGVAVAGGCRALRAGARANREYRRRRRMGQSHRLEPGDLLG